MSYLLQQREWWLKGPTNWVCLPAISGCNQRFSWPIFSECIDNYRLIWNKGTRAERMWKNVMVYVDICLNLMRVPYMFGKLSYVTNLNQGHSRGWFPILTMIAGFGREARSSSNLLRYIQSSCCTTSCAWMLQHDSTPYKYQWDMGLSGSSWRYPKSWMLSMEKANKKPPGWWLGVAPEEISTSRWCWIPKLRFLFMNLVNFPLELPIILCKIPSERVRKWWGTTEKLPLNWETYEKTHWIVGVPQSFQTNPYKAPLGQPTSLAWELLIGVNQ